MKNIFLYFLWAFGMIYGIVIVYLYIKNRNKPAQKVWNMINPFLGDTYYEKNKFIMFVVTLWTLLCLLMVSLGIGFMFFVAYKIFIS